MTQQEIDVLHHAKESLATCIEQRNKAIDRANMEIALRVTVEIERNGLRTALRDAYSQISELKFGAKTTT